MATNTVDPATWRSPSLGEGRVLGLPAGKLLCHDVGSGPVLVFVHGLLVNANLWRKLVERLSADFRCVVLDLPIGSHILPREEGADNGPVAVANLAADAIEALGLEDVTLIGNDSGGVMSQVIVTTRPEHIGWLAKRPIERETEDAYLLPAMSSGAVRNDTRKFIKGADVKITNAAADRLGEFDKPALIAWSTEDKAFPPKDGVSLAAALPDSRLEWVDDAYTFSMEDNPDRLAELIRDFVR